MSYQFATRALTTIWRLTPRKLPAVLYFTAGHRGGRLRMYQRLATFFQFALMRLIGLLPLPAPVVCRAATESLRGARRSATGVATKRSLQVTVPGAEYLKSGSAGLGFQKSNLRSPLPGS